MAGSDGKFFDELADTQDRSGKVEAVHVALLGDSVLDNQFWLVNPRWDVRFFLERILRSRGPVQSRQEDGKTAELGEPRARASLFAVDESQISHVSRGIRPRAPYKASRACFCMEPYPVGEDGIVRPIRLLARSRATHAVLSIGGNDARAAFARTFDVDGIYNAMVGAGVVRHFDELVERVVAECPRTMLVLVYHPQVTACPLLNALPPRNVLTELISRFSPMFIAAAKRHGLPIVDLSRTFDPYDCTHYGSSPIEPGVRGGRMIAQLVARVVRRFRWGVDPPALYSLRRDGDLRVDVLDDKFDNGGRHFGSLLRAHLDTSAARGGWVLPYLCCPVPQSLLQLAIAIVIVALVIVLSST